MSERLPWRRARDQRVDAQMDRFDEVCDAALQRWRAAEIAKIDAAWEKLVPLLPDDRVWDWLDHLSTCVRTGASWSPAFPVADVATHPHVPLERRRPVMATQRQSSGKVTPARARREQRFSDVQRLMSSGVRQKDIAVQLGISQATVSNWIRSGI